MESPRSVPVLSGPGSSFKFEAWKLCLGLRLIIPTLSPHKDEGLIQHDYSGGKRIHMSHHELNQRSFGSRRQVRRTTVFSHGAPEITTDFPVLPHALSRTIGGVIDLRFSPSSYISFNKEIKGWRDSLVAKSFCCSSRRPGFCSHHPYQVAHNHLQR